MYVCRYVRMYVCMYVLYVCIYVCMYACAYICMYVCMYRTWCMYVCMYRIWCMYVCTHASHLMYVCVCVSYVMLVFMHALYLVHVRMYRIWCAYICMYVCVASVVCMCASHQMYVHIYYMHVCTTVIAMRSLSSAQVELNSTGCGALSDRLATSDCTDSHATTLSTPPPAWFSLAWFYPTHSSVCACTIMSANPTPFEMWIKVVLLCCLPLVCKHSILWVELQFSGRIHTQP